MGFALTPGEAPLHFSRSKNVMHVDQPIPAFSELHCSQKSFSVERGAQGTGVAVAKGMQDAGNQAAHIAQNAGDAVAKCAQDAGAGIADGVQQFGKGIADGLKQLPEIKLTKFGWGKK